MKILPKSRGGRIWLATAIFMLAGIWTVVAVSSLRDVDKVKKMTEKTKTVCVGRFLIDMPENAQVSLSRAFVHSFHISTDADQSDEEFDKQMADLEADLAIKKNAHGLPSLESTTLIKREHAHGKIYAYGREWTPWLENGVKSLFESYTVHGLIRLDGVSFTIKSDGMAADGAKWAAKIIDQLRPLAQGEIPTEPGFCIDRLIIRDPLTDDDGERVTMFAGLPDHPDLAIVFDTMAGTKPGASLLTRDANNNDIKKEYSSHFKTLRSAARTVAGIPGEELVERVREMNFTTGFSFEWENLETAGNVFAPSLSFEMDTGISERPGGKPRNSSLREDALLLLWDQMLSSIRLRPTSAPATGVDAGSKIIPPRGTVATAGERCPQSGWWTCNEGGNGLEVQGGQTQYIRGHEALPQAVLLPPSTFWERLIGRRRTYSRDTPTRWTLTNYRKYPRPSVTVALAQSIPPASEGIQDPPLADGALATPTPVGQRASTSYPCPASGWWTCLEPGALDGTRWFAQRALLPLATVRVKRSWLERMRSGPQLQQVRGIWELVRHDVGTADAPFDDNNSDA